MRPNVRSLERLRLRSTNSFPPLKILGFSDQTSLRKSIELTWLKLVRAYTINTPINRGRYRVLLAAMRPCRELPLSVVSKLPDGRRFAYKLGKRLNETVFFLGEYEKAVTETMRRLIRPGDICLDVGANSGWYTTLFSAAGAEVHSFEPMPLTFVDLQKNVELNGGSNDVHLNNFALGDSVGEVRFNSFLGLSSGYASMSDLGRDDAVPVKCRIDTVSNYVDSILVGRPVTLVKVDIEGAEMSFLKGADRLFEQTCPPILQIEMALELTRNFDYHPNDLIRYISGKGDFHFFAVDEVAGTLHEIDGFRREQIGANVFCVPKQGRNDRLASIRDLIVK